VDNIRKGYKHDAKQVEDSLEHCVTKLANPRRCSHALWNAAEPQEAGFARVGSGQSRTSVQEIAPCREMFMISSSKPSRQLVPVSQRQRLLQDSSQFLNFTSPPSRTADLLYRPGPA